jgi:hypothetical protein
MYANQESAAVAGWVIAAVVIGGGLVWLVTQAKSAPVPAPTAAAPQPAPAPAQQPAPAAQQVAPTPAAPAPAPTNAYAPLAPVAPKQLPGHYGHHGFGHGVPSLSSMFMV